MFRIWIRIQNLDSAPDDRDIFLHLLQHDHVNYFLFLRVKTLPTNQNEFFFKMFCPRFHSF